MQVLSRWRNILILEATVPRLIRIGTANPSTSHLASFHSTEASFDKCKSKFNMTVLANHAPNHTIKRNDEDDFFVWDEENHLRDGRSNQRPPKNYIRYAVRQKRADAKKALKNLLFDGGCSTSRAKDSFSKIEADYGDQLNKKSRVKPARQSRRAYHMKVKRKNRRENICEDFDENPERIFQATFGNGCFTWTFKPWEMGFDCRETSGWNNSRYEGRDSKRRIESDDESFNVGAYADRKILGLPTAGPLKIEDVKSAFRLSALKWHPDKHQGPSQAAAEERFKNCANAYKSLCNALSTT